MTKNSLIEEIMARNFFNAFHTKPIFSVKECTRGRIIAVATTSCIGLNAQKLKK
tara:strand:- start:204 stop:365 length:162 start_codon:yes stop_codon:yes gene_type:complete